MRILVCALVLTFCAGGSAGAQTVRMSPQIQARMGVEVAPLAGAIAPVVANGYARVLDVGPLAALDADIATAQSAAVASEAERRRLEALANADQSASQRSLEAARAQAAADSARAALAARRIGLEWGPALARLSASARARLISDIAHGRAALVRVDAPLSAPSARAITLRPDASAAIRATPLGAAATADTRLQTSGVLAIVRGQDSTRLPAGRLLRADIETTAPEEGVLAPRDALVRVGQAVWVYVRARGDVFERRQVIGARPIAGGWFVKNGFRAGEMVAVAGAASLLAAEQNASRGGD